MKKTVEIMNPWEAVRAFVADKELREEYTKDSALFRNMDLSDDDSIMAFLDNDAGDIRRLGEEECELLGLEYDCGWYIDTFNRKYLTTAY